MSSNETAVLTGDLPKPLLYRPIGKTPVYTLMNAARFLARTNEPIEGVRNRLKHMAQAGLIHRKFVPGHGPTDPAYFGIEDLAAGEVVHRVLGIPGAGPLVSLACYAWHRSINPRPAYIPTGVSPIVAAMIGASQGQSWALRLAEFHDEKSGQKVFFAALHNMDVPLPDIGGTLPPSFLNESDAVMNITRLMLRFAHFLREELSEL
jgi:hypothetical protein